MFTIVGRTEGGVDVVSGVYRFYETHGLPLDVVLETLKSREAMPCWTAFYQEATAAGMKHKRILSKLEESISDIFGSSFCAHVLGKLQKMHDDGEI
jgi:alanyl-tRNA synthetase